MEILFNSNKKKVRERSPLWTPEIFVHKWPWCSLTLDFFCSSLFIFRSKLWEESWLDGFRERGSGDLEENDGQPEQLGWGRTSPQVFHDSQEVRPTLKTSGNYVVWFFLFYFLLPDWWWTCTWSDFSGIIWRDLRLNPTQSHQWTCSLTINS